MPYADESGEFTRLLAEHKRWLRASALSMMMNQADADDVYQLAVVTMWENFDDFEIGTSFTAWAGRILYLKALNQRRRRRRDKLEFSDAFLDTVAGITLSEAHESGMVERAMALKECVAKLTPQHQQMLTARYTDGVSADQMGETFNRSGAAVRNALKRIRQSLHKCISQRVQQRESEWQKTQKNQKTTTSRKQDRRL